MKCLLAVLLLAQMLCMSSCAKENVVSSWWLSRELLIVCDLFKTVFLRQRKERWGMSISVSYWVYDSGCSRPPELAVITP